MSTKLESVAQLASRVGKSERQVRSWISNSLIRHYRLGGKIEIPVGAFEEMLEATEIAPEFEPKQNGKAKRQRRPSFQTQNKPLDADMLDKLASEF